MHATTVADTRTRTSGPQGAGSGHLEWHEIGIDAVLVLHAGQLAHCCVVQHRHANTAADTLGGTSGPQVQGVASLEWHANLAIDAVPVCMLSQTCARCVV